MFDARTFPTLDDGIAHARSIGFGVLAERGVAAAHSLTERVVYIGISMGVMAAQQLAQTRAGAAGAVLIDACIAVREFGETWPAGTPVQVHGMDADPAFAGEGDLDAARELVEATDRAKLYLYPGDSHLFSDSSLPTYDAEATSKMVSRILEFLSRVQ